MFKFLKNKKIREERNIETISVENVDGNTESLYIKGLTDNFKTKEISVEKESFYNDYKKSSSKPKPKFRQGISDTMSGFEESYNPSININPGLKDPRQVSPKGASDYVIPTNNTPVLPPKQKPINSSYAVHSEVKRKKLMTDINKVINNDVIFDNAQKNKFLKADQNLDVVPEKMEPKKIIRSVSDLNNPGSAYLTINRNKNNDSEE